MVLINIIAIHPNSLPSPFPHPCHSLIFSRDRLRSPSGIISGPGSFAIRDHLRSWDHLRTRTEFLAVEKHRHATRTHFFS